MPIPTKMADIFTVANSNSPAGTESAISTDDFHRAIQSILRHTHAKGTDIASAATIDLGAATGEFVDITGVTSITSLGTVDVGIRRTVRFTGALTLTHNATSLILPSLASIVTANGDAAEFVSLGVGNWKCTNYIRQDGSALAIQDLSITTAKVLNTAITNAKLNADVAVSNADYVIGTNTTQFLNAATARARNIVAGTSVATTSGTSIDFTGLPLWVKRITVMFNGVSVSATSTIQVQLGTSTGIEATGYLGNITAMTGTINTNALGSGFPLATTANSNAAATLHGAMVISKLSSLVWEAVGNFADTAAIVGFRQVGGKTLAGDLDRVRITTVNGTDTFDAGSINILYE